MNKQCKYSYTDYGSLVSGNQTKKQPFYGPLIQDDLVESVPENQINPHYPPQ